MCYLIGIQIKFISTILIIVGVDLGVLVNDLKFAHTLSKHNRDAGLNGSQHRHAQRV